MNSETARALEQAYEVFGRYEDEHNLVRKSGVLHSPRNLTREDWAAMNTTFDMEVQLYSDEALLLRHFLPRFLESLSDDHGAIVVEPWLLAFRLKHFRWIEWPAEEVKALRAVFEAWLGQLFTDTNAQMPIEFLTEIQEELTPYLEVWLEARPHELANWLWTLNWLQNQSAWNWALQPHVEASLEAAFFRHPDGETARGLSQSIELIRSLKQMNLS